MLKNLFVSFFLLTNLTAFAQDDLLSLVGDSAAAKTSREKVYATFKTTKILNGQSIECVKGRTLDFRVTHRFDNIGTGGSGHTLWGFDNSSDIRISFDYGVTDNWTLGFSRSKQRELLEGYTKWRFLEQQKGGGIPVSVALYSSMAYTPIAKEALYEDVDKSVERKEIHRLSYFHQLIIARKFGSMFSLQLMPSYHHRNFVRADVNTNNGNAEETNGLFSMGIGGRLRFTKRMALLVDYFYTNSPFRTNNKQTPFYNPLAVGLEIETGGHVFHLNFTNNAAISEMNFIPNTTSNWLDGEFKFGFNISRVFSF